VEEMVSKLEKKLQDLVLNDAIKSYDLYDVSDEGIAGVESKFRNSQVIKITFNSGDELCISACSSGCMENVTFFLVE
jgi:hypothetical protein